MMRHIKIIKDEVKKFNLNKFKDLTFEGSEEYLLEAGHAPYKLYAYISEVIDNVVIVEVGTRFGGSALAFSYNDKNKIISYDIIDCGASKIDRKNILFKIEDFTKDESIDWGGVDIIMIDVDPHDGIKEREFMTFLESVEWEGILILDDILANWPRIVHGADPEAMNAWWNGLTYEKYDISDVGHCSGTGLVNIGNKFKIEII